MFDTGIQVVTHFEKEFILYLKLYISSFVLKTTFVHSTMMRFSQLSDKIVPVNEL